MPRISRTRPAKAVAAIDPNRRLVDRPHPDDRLDPAKLGRPGTVRRVTVNLRENPIDWLHARGHLSDRQLAAGNRLRADFERGQLGAQTTMRWDSVGSSGAGSGGGRRGAPVAPDLSASAIDAKRRFEGALDAAGPGLSDILWRIACEGQGMAEAEKTLGWPTRSGRLVLTLALDRVASFYGLR